MMRFFLGMSIYYSDPIYEYFKKEWFRLIPIRVRNAGIPVPVIFRFQYIFGYGNSRTENFSVPAQKATQ